MKFLYLVILCLIAFVYCEEVCLTGECKEVEVVMNNMPVGIIPSRTSMEQSMFVPCEIPDPDFKNGEATIPPMCVKPDDWDEELDGEWDPNCLHLEDRGINSDGIMSDLLYRRSVDEPTQALPHTSFTLRLPEDWIALQNQVKELREAIVSLKTKLADQERKLWIQQFFGNMMMNHLNDTVLDQFAELSDRVEKELF